MTTPAKPSRTLDPHRRGPTVPPPSPTGLASVLERNIRALEERRRREEQEASREERLAELITRFTGSMPFVYLHVLWFALWILVGVEPFPFGLLTMLVSLEAIFLSAFVLISQNHADERRQAIAIHQWEVIQLEERQTQEILSLARQILANTKAIQRTTGR